MRWIISCLSLALPLSIAIPSPGGERQIKSPKTLTQGGDARYTAVLVGILKQETVAPEAHVKERALVLRNIVTVIGEKHEAVSLPSFPPSSYTDQQIPFAKRPIRYINGRRYLVLIGLPIALRVDSSPEVLEVIDLDETANEAQAKSRFIRPDRSTSLLEGPKKPSDFNSLRGWIEALQPRIAQAVLTTKDVVTALGEPDYVEITDPEGEEVTAHYRMISPGHPRNEMAPKEPILVEYEFRARADVVIQATCEELDPKYMGSEGRF